MKKLTKNELVEATTNINTVLEMDMVTTSTNDQLGQALCDAACLLETGDMEKVTPETVATLHALGCVLPGDADPEITPEQETAAETEQAVKSDRSKVGIIKTIYRYLEKPCSKKTILARLVKKFPERNPDAMWRTINTQIPHRINNEQKFNVAEVDGKWSIVGA